MEISYEKLGDFLKLSHVTPVKSNEYHLKIDDWESGRWNSLFVNGPFSGCMVISSIIVMEHRIKEKRGG